MILLAKRVDIDLARAMPCRHAPARHGHPAPAQDASNCSGRNSPASSTTISAGRPARLAASRIASPLSASYRQYVFRLSADKNEYSHFTPTAVFISTTALRSSEDAFNAAAKFLSIMNSAMSASVKLR